LIAGNWKMNLLRAEAEPLLADLRAGAAGLACDLLVCPPATLLGLAAAALSGSAIALGGQDCHAAPSGAHTGDIAAPMLRDAGARYVIVGHSERRTEHNESDAGVRAKAEAAAAAGLVPIVCVGESRAERVAGRAESVVAAQLDLSLPDGFAGAIAYEPVWAIGTGLVASADDVAAMHRHIRLRLTRRFGTDGAAVRILYGGSVKPDNAAALLHLPEVGGALVGGASLAAASFLEIARAG